MIDKVIIGDVFFLDIEMVFNKYYFEELDFVL